jgi:hypothetical protein
MMKQERAVSRAGVSWMFGTGKLAFMAQVSFIMAILINCLSIYTLSYDSQDENATVVQHTPQMLMDMSISTPTLVDVLTWIQCVSASYLLLANIVLHLPVVWATSARERRHERATLGLGKVKDPMGFIYPTFAVLTDFMFLYQGVYLAFAIMSILFEL